MARISCHTQKTTNPARKRGLRLISVTTLAFDRRSHGITAFGDDWAVRGHFGVQNLIIGPFGRKVVFVENRGGRAFGDARFAVDAFFRVDEEHRFPFVEAFDGANRHTVGVLAVEAGLGDHMRHVRLTFPKT